MSVCVYCVFVLFGVYVAALRWADPPSKESYRLCKRLRNWKSGQGPTKGCRATDEGEGCWNNLEGKSLNISIEQEAQITQAPHSSPTTVR
jgi:hypothetical protein